MQITWERTWPRWVGVACTVFGFANIVGALAGPSEIMFPGVVIGSVWAAVGLKGGLPLFASAPQGVASLSEKIAQGLRTIRRRRIATFLCLLAWLPVAAVILPRTPERLLPTVFLVTALPVGASFAVWALSACPRCGRHFLAVWRLGLSVSLSRCHACGVSLHDA